MYLGLRTCWQLLLLLYIGRTSTHLFWFPVACGASCEDVDRPFAAVNTCTSHPHHTYLPSACIQPFLAITVHGAVLCLSPRLELTRRDGQGASKGEGLGNQFLANIRECDAIVHGETEHT